jgi:hypothetical protein
MDKVLGACSEKGAGPSHGRPFLEIRKSQYSARYKI